MKKDDTSSDLEKSATMDFLVAKHGAPQVLRDFASGVGQATANGAIAAISTAAVTATAVGARKVYQALTRERDFRNMMGANPHLQEYHDQDPKRFNLVYNSLRSMNPEFSADPIIAGSYMARASMAPAQAGTMLGTELGIPSRRNVDRFLDHVQSQTAGSARMPQPKPAAHPERSMSGSHAPPPDNFHAHGGYNLPSGGYGPEDPGKRRR